MRLRLLHPPGDAATATLFASAPVDLTCLPDLAVGALVAVGELAVGGVQEPHEDALEDPT